MTTFYDKFTDDQKICYLIGALASYTAYVQESNMYNQEEKKEESKDENNKEEKKFGPFRRKFNNLKLNKGKLKEIFVDCVEKLNQYERKVPKWFSDEFKKIDKDILEIGLNNVSISYYFALGYAIGQRIFNDDNGGDDE